MISQDQKRGGIWARKKNVFGKSDSQSCAGAVAQWWSAFAACMKS